MSGITEPSIDKYIRDLIPKRDPVLREMEERASRERIPIIGPVVGTLLSQLARSIRAKRVFELGSAIGYSTIWLARALQPGGKIYYTDGNAENARAAEAYFERAGVRDRIEIRVGDALTHFESVDGDFDFIFNDVDKHGYPEVYRKAAGRVRVGGFFVTDNTLWSARVVDPAVNDADTKGVREFNTLLSADSRFETTVLPLRDGVAVALRLS
jgi:caffeoyl-CoA O-methyltransferase